MKYIEVGLNQILKVTRLGFTHQTTSTRHVTRYTSEYIVYAVENGRLKLSHNGETLELLPGDIYIFNKGEYQKPLENTDCDFHFLHFDSENVVWHELSDAKLCDLIRVKKADYLKSDIFSADGYKHIKAFVNQRLHVDDRKTFEYILSFFKNNNLCLDGNDPLRRLNISFAAAELLLKLEELGVESVCGTNRKSRRAFGTAERIAA